MMLETIGDILNYIAAVIIFPLMALPLAAKITQGRISSALTFSIVVAVVAAAGLAFVTIVPALSPPQNTGQITIFAAFIVLISILVYFSGGASAASAKVSKVSTAITAGAGRAVMWLLLLMVMIQFAVVLLRYVFGVNWIFMQESVTYMHGIIFLLAAGYALLSDDHVRVDIFYRSASKKRKAIVELVGTYFALFPICLLIFWSASPYVARSWLVFEGSTDTSGIQGVYLLKSLIPTFAILMTMAGFTVAHRAVETLNGRTH